MCLEGPNHPPIDYVIDDYQHGMIDRRQFLARASALLGVSAASVLVAACSPQAAAPPAAVATTAPKAVAPTSAPPTAAPPTAAPPATATSAPTAAPKATDAPKAATTAPTAAPKATDAPKAAAVPAYGTVPADAAGITIEKVTFKSGTADIKGYLARPSTGGPNPAILIFHENRGITPHEEDMARRYAKAGFVALAIDMLSRQGGSDKFATQQEKTAAIGQTKPDENLADTKAAVTYLKGLPSVQNMKVGVTGYCWGGQRTNIAAANIPEVAAAVPYYGSPPTDLNEVRNMNAALLMIYGGTDTRINASIPDYEAKLKEFNKTYQVKIYDGAGHAFNNDTGPNFNAAAAKDAWEQAVAWFNKYLRS